MEYVIEPELNNWPFSVNKNDIGEKNNVAKSHPEIVNKAEELFKTEHVPNPLWKKPFE